jgi:phosphoglycolate phosphatase-like HAD superfamily hydrolase
MIIFDLDQTLIDSSAAEPLRRKRKWNDVYALIPSLKPYPGIDGLITKLHSKGVLLAIATSSPRPYCTKVINQWRWPITNIVAYHDTKDHKPAPDPILKAIKNGGSPSEDNFYVGDMPVDTQAANAASVTSLGALWGSPDQNALKRSLPDFVFSTVEELSEYLLGHE